mmetsp:Transcript_18230/g.27089  ORF Transcript_18230/g.27089 Transcript_18230/m.27089 type:complete len:239 (-) Transcript_18230:235-951(-)
MHHELTLHDGLLLSLLLALLVLEQDLPHLGSTLPQGLTGLLTGAIITNFKPETLLLILLEEAPIHLTDGADDGAGDGRLVILASFKVGPTVGIDKITETAVARMNVCPSPAATEDVVPGIELDPLLGRWDGSLLRKVAGGCRGIRHGLLESGALHLGLGTFGTNGGGEVIPGHFQLTLPHHGLGGQLGVAVAGGEAAHHVGGELASHHGVVELSHHHRVGSSHAGHRSESSDGAFALG